MDRRERHGDQLTMMLAIFEGWQSGLWTALPGIVQSVNLAKQTCDVTSALRVKIELPDGSWDWTEIPLMRDCPIYFPHGGGVSLTFPVVAGDECLIVFASRCIDAWWQSGGLQNQAELRMHDLSDGMCFVGFRSTPKVVPGISSTTGQLRNEAGTTFVEVDPAGNITLTATGNVNINGTLIINGNPYLAHVHKDVAAGSSNTGVVA